MAVLSRKRTGMSETVWEFYIEGKDDWEKMAEVLFVESKKPVKWREVLFVESKKPVKLIDENGKAIPDIELKSKEQLILLSNESKLIGRFTCINVRAKSVEGWISISKVGYPARNTTAAEDKTLSDLNKLIRSVDETGRGITIVVRSNKKIHFVFKNCTGAKTNKGTPKSDFYIHNNLGKSVCEISHKKSGGPGRFQQYVSLTGRKNDIVNQHPFVKKALSAFAEHIDEIRGSKKRFYVEIPFNTQNNLLINAAIYGIDFKKKYGKNHVHLIGQGDPILSEFYDKSINDGLCYELNFSDHIAVSGDIEFFKSGGYEPIILVRYGGDRTFKANGVIYKKGRVLLCPIMLKGTAEELQV